MCSYSRRPTPESSKQHYLFSTIYNYCHPESTVSGIIQNFCKEGVYRICPSHSSNLITSLPNYTSDGITLFLLSSVFILVESHFRLRRLTKVWDEVCDGHRRGRSRLLTQIDYFTLSERTESECSCDVPRRTRRQGDVPGTKVRPVVSI